MNMVIYAGAHRLEGSALEIVERLQSKVYGGFEGSLGEYIKWLANVVKRLSREETVAAFAEAADKWDGLTDLDKWAEGLVNALGTVGLVGRE